MFNKIDSLRGRNAEILGHEQSFKSAVILPLVSIDNRIHVLFEKRAHDLIHQPGEISFPGGKMETSDGGPEQAAVRETCEELGLEPHNIEVIAPLDIMVSPFNVIVYPFLAIIDDVNNIKPSPDEVDEVFYVPLDYLLENEPLRHSMYVNIEVPEEFPFELIPKGKEYPFSKGYLPQLFWLWNEHVIWGLTARILNNFINLLKQ